MLYTKMVMISYQFNYWTYLLLCTLTIATEIPFVDEYCSNEPVDIVYTWVNGSDPVFLKKLERFNSGNTVNATYTQTIKIVTLKAILVDYQSSLRNFKKILSMSERFDEVSSVHALSNRNFLVSFKRREALKNATQSNHYFKETLPFQEVYYSDIGDFNASKTVLFTNLHKDLTDGYLWKFLENIKADCIESIQLHYELNVGVVHFKEEEFVKHFILNSPYMVKDKTINFIQAKYLIKGHNIYKAESGKNRFADNDELKYSLRSVIKHVPWIRNVYIVTNGQIPKWLNLSNPRIRIVTHKEIFLNHSHLPTFSSRAIESHIHRIQGLSKHYIYSNDDMFFGKNISTQDYFTSIGGYKIYLAWQLDNCNRGCYRRMIGNNKCNLACNVSKCDWDDGDCNEIEDWIESNEIRENNEIKSKPVEASAIKFSPESKRKMFKEKLKEVMKNQDVLDLLFKMNDKKAGKKFLRYILQRELAQDKYNENINSKRKLMSAYIGSMQFVSNIYNKEFESIDRHALAHMPHLFNKDIVHEMHHRFESYFDLTSSYKIRQSDSMQPTFAYFYYVMGVRRDMNHESIFSSLDADKSGTISNDELQQFTVATHQKDMKFELMQTKDSKDICKMNFNMRNNFILRTIQNCQHSLSGIKPDFVNMTKSEFLNCGQILKYNRNVRLNNKYSNAKYNYETIEISRQKNLVGFVMIKENIYQAYSTLSGLLRSQPKFICINDDIKTFETNTAVEKIRDLVNEYYEKKFPEHSEFELNNMENQLLHMDKMKVCLSKNNGIYEACLVKSTERERIPLAKLDDYRKEYEGQFKEARHALLEMSAFMNNTKLNGNKFEMDDNVIRLLASKGLLDTILKRKVQVNERKKKENERKEAKFESRKINSIDSITNKEENKKGDKKIMSNDEKEKKESEHNRIEINQEDFEGNRIYSLSKAKVNFYNLRLKEEEDFEMDEDDGINNLLLQDQNTEYNELNEDKQKKTNQQYKKWKSFKQLFKIVYISILFVLIFFYTYRKLYIIANKLFIWFVRCVLYRKEKIVLCY